MIELKEVSSVDAEEFLALWKIYTATFPRYEQRTLDSQKKCLQNKRYKLFAVVCAGEVIGLLDEWEFNGFIFVEHFAIKESARSKGVGAKLILEYFASKDKVCVTEVERPKTKSDAKKLNFLKKIGAKLSQFNYSHPAYAQGEKEISVFLVSYPNKISKKEFEQIRVEIEREVAHVK